MPGKRPKAKPDKAGQSTKALPYWLNQREMAMSCGVSIQAFIQWNVKSAAKIGREAFYTVEAVLENRLARQLERVEASRPATPEHFDAEADRREKTMLIREQRIGQELKNAQTRRELAPVSVLEWTLGKIGSQISAILESIPMRVKKVLPKLSATEIEHIKREVVKAQNAAARITVDLDDYYDGDPSGDREADPARVADAPTA